MSKQAPAMTFLERNVYGEIVSPLLNNSNISMDVCCVPGLSMPLGTL